MYSIEFRTIEDQTLNLINEMILKWKECWPKGYFVTVKDVCTDDDEGGYYSGYDILISKRKRIVDLLTIMVVVNGLVFFDREKLEHHLDFVFYESIYQLIA